MHILRTMTTPTLESLRNRAEAIHRQYDAHFAGQPRITRDASLLDAIIDETDAALADARGVPGAEPVLERLRQNRAMYQQEVAAVRAAQAQGPEAFEVHRIGTWAGLVFDLYRRHFAGKSRGTRDLGLIGELIDLLERLDAESASLSARVGAIADLADVRSGITENLALYRKERAAIVSARGAGTLEEQGDLLAAVANGQFTLYRVHFAGKSRVSRRPALLARMIGALETVGDRMRALRAQGLHAESNDKNIEIVEARLAAWREEIEAIRAQKQKTSFADLVTALGTAANEVFATYRKQFAGQDRTTREPEELGELLDQLIEVARLMDDLDRVRDDAGNQHNLGVVLDHLRLYQREYGLILDARRPQ